MRNFLREFLFGGAGGRSPMADAGLLLLRVFTGLAMAFAHGLSKIKDPSGIIRGADSMGFPVPTFFGWMAAFSEFFGGILLALGILTRPSAFLLACTMATAGFLRHARDPFARKELAFLYLAVAVLYLLAGGGRFSVDALVRKLWGSRPRSDGPGFPVR